VRQPSPFRGKTGSEPRRTFVVVSRTAASRREVGRRRTLLLVTPRARRRREPTVGRAEDGRGNVDVRAWADSPGAKVPGPSRRRTVRESRSEVPLLRGGSSTPWSSGGVFPEGLETLPHVARPRSPSRRPPRRGASSRQSGCFLPPGNWARVRRAPVHVVRLESTSRHAAPPRGEVALQSRGTRLSFPFRTSTPGPDETSDRIGSTNVGERLSTSDPRLAAAPPKVSTIDSARATTRLVRAFELAIKPPADRLPESQPI